jgi:hypothetical protein
LLFKKVPTFVYRDTIPKKILFLSFYQWNGGEICQGASFEKFGINSFMSKACESGLELSDGKGRIPRWIPREDFAKATPSETIQVTLRKVDD